MATAALVDLDQIEEMIEKIVPTQFISEKRENELIRLSELGMHAEAIRLAIREAIEAVVIKTAFSQ